MIGIGPRLKRERTRLKLSQSALGAIGGVETNAQGNYENGLRYPRADYLSRVSEAGIDIAYVVTGQEKRYTTVATPVVSDLNRVIARLHTSLHDMNQQLYQMTQLLERRQSDDAGTDRLQIETVRDDAQAISLAAVRLIYVTSKLS
ncbi:helix-turn-helix transcriptional regulator [Pseudomonas sp. 3A(2025)]